MGEKLAVLGTNGVGKSTLLKTLVGDLQPDSGTVNGLRTRALVTTPRTMNMSSKMI